MKHLILLAAISCMTVQVSGQKPTLPDNLSYFPASMYIEIGNRIDSMSFIARSKLLRDFDEPGLNTQQQDISVYRLTWTRSFHEVMIIRLKISGESGTIITKKGIKQPTNQSEGKNKIAADTEETYQVDSTNLDRAIITQFQTLLKEKRFWEIKNVWPVSAIRDGAGWLLEANDKEKGYKMLFRNSPGKNEQDFLDICLFLIRLTKDSDKLEVY